MTAQLLKALVSLLFQLALLVPKGYLTKITTGLSVLVGLGMLASSVLQAIQTGSVPTSFDQVTDQQAFGVLFTLVGGAAAGIGRKLEALHASVTPPPATPPTPPAA